MKTFLIAHTNDDGTGVAQAQIGAPTEGKARIAFRRMYPLRLLQTIGILGEGDEPMFDYGAEAEANADETNEETKDAA